ncbi:tail terminator [Aeromonas phage vB_AveS_KLEA5]|nr:tail terminator [Aeromonas phage vB_AveS_KLEA5]
MNTALIALLKATLGSGITVYSGTVPEGVTKPCVGTSMVSNADNRVITGQKYGNAQVYRVTVFAPTQSQIQGILDTLETLDNTKNADFQRIFGQWILTEAKQPGQVLARAFYDLTVYI